MEFTKKIKLYVVDFEKDIVRRLDELFNNYPEYNIKFVGSSYNYSSCLNDYAHWVEADVFLISAYLSDMMGTELIHPIRLKNPNAKIIVTVKSNTLNHGEEATRKGADKILTKPIAFTELVDVIKELTESSYEDNDSYEEGIIFTPPTQNVYTPSSPDIVSSLLNKHLPDEDEEDEDNAPLTQSSSPFQTFTSEPSQSTFSQPTSSNISPKPIEPTQQTTFKPSFRQPDELQQTPKPKFKPQANDAFLNNKPNHVVTFSSSMSSGKTTLIVNTAIAIHRFSQYKPRICIVDFNLLFPSVQLKFNQTDLIKCKKNIYELIEDIEDLSEDLVNQALVEHEPTGIKILNTPRNILRATEINNFIIEKLFTQLRSMFDLILVDTSSNIELPSNTYPLVISDKNFLVVEPEVTSVVHTQRLCSLIRTLESGSGRQILNKTHIVLNRQKSKPLIELEDIKTTINHTDIRFVIPEDTKILEHGNNALSVIDYPSLSTKYIKELSRAIYPFDTSFSIGQSKSSSSGKTGTSSKNLLSNLFNRKKPN